MKEEYQNNNQNLYTVSRMTYKGYEVSVKAESYEKASQWMFRTLKDGPVNFVELASEARDNDNVFIQDVRQISSDIPVITTDGEDPLADKLYNGYDFDAKAYVFSVVDRKVDRCTVMAESLQKAEEKVRNMDLSVEEIDKMQSFKENRLYGASEDEKVILKKYKMLKYHSEKELTDRLRQQFPDGLTVTLESESLKNLQCYKQAIDDGKWLTFNGMLAEDGVMPSAYGNLQARIQIQPEDYDMIMACENTYWSNELSELGWETDTNTTSMLLTLHPDDLQNVRVEIAVDERSLQKLLIEGKPYEKVMDVVAKYNIKDELQLQYFNLLNDFADFPEWKKKMAENSLKEERERLWNNIVKPAKNEEMRMWNVTMEQAAVENGYNSSRDYKKDVEWTKDPSPELKEKMQKVQTRHMELYSPYQTKSRVASTEFDCKFLNNAISFLHRFEEEAKKQIQEVSVKKKGNDFFVSCNFSGNWKLTKKITQEEGEKIQNAPDKETSDTIRAEVAQKYFHKQIEMSMSNEQVQSRKL